MPRQNPRLTRERSKEPFDLLNLINKMQGKAQQLSQEEHSETGDRHEVTLEPQKAASRQAAERERLKAAAARKRFLVAHANSRLTEMILPADTRIHINQLRLVTNKELYFQDPQKNPRTPSRDVRIQPSKLNTAMEGDKIPTTNQTVTGSAAPLETENHALQLKTD